MDNMSLEEVSVRVKALAEDLGELLQRHRDGISDHDGTLISVEALSIAMALEVLMHGECPPDLGLVPVAVKIIQGYPWARAVMVAMKALAQAELSLRNQEGG